MEKPNKATILLVDDRPANILVLENLLAAKDRTILNATNGKDALQITLNKAIDLIILDVQMPDMDGFEVAQILKSNKRTKDIPIIFASAEKKEHKFMMKGFEEGAIDYLFKPLDPEIARAKVAVLLKVQLQKKELLEKNNSLQKSALLINNSADIIGIIDTKTFTIEEINNAFTDILGYSKEEARGTSLTFFLSQEDRSFIQGLGKNTNDRLSFETRIYCKDRSLKWLHWKVVQKDDKWFINARDITEVKEIEKIRNYLATVVKQSNDAIYIHDNEGKIISWNDGAEKIYGYREKEALRMKLWNIIPEYMQPEIEEIVSSILAGEKIQLLQTKRITKHGKMIDVLLSASVITEQGNDQKSIAITERDITLQKKADEQIRQLNTDLQTNIAQLETENTVIKNLNKEIEKKNEELNYLNLEKDRFMGMVSHDLKNHISAMLLTLCLMEKNIVSTDGNQLKYINRLRRSVVNMQRLLGDYLSVNRIQQGIVNPDYSLVDLAKQIGDMVEGYYDIAAQKKLTLNYSNNCKDALLNTDVSYLGIIADNLISNAIKYSPLGGKIDIIVSKQSDRYCLEVKDEGPGIPESDIPKLYGRFQKLTPKPTAGEPSNGLGLSIVKDLANALKATIECKSTEGKGTSFIVLF